MFTYVTYNINTHLHVWILKNSSMFFPWFSECLRSRENNKKSINIPHTIYIFAFKRLSNTNIWTQSLGAYVLRAVRRTILIYDQYIFISFILLCSLTRLNPLWYRLKLSFIERLSEEVILNKKKSLYLKANKKLFIRLK